MDLSRPPASAMRMDRTPLYLTALNMAALGYGFWAAINNPNVLQYKLARLADPAINNTLLGLFAIGGYLVATVAQPLVGALSDRTRGRFGRRTPFMLIGMLGCIGCAAALLSAGSLLVLFGAVLLNQVFSNTIQGPYQALIPDQVGEHQRGLSAGVKTIIELLGVIGAGIAVQRLLATEQLGALLAAIAIVFVLATLTTILVARDRGYEAHEGKGPKAQAAHTVETFEQPVRPFWPFMRELLRDPAHRNLRLWLLNRFLFWAALIALRQFIIGYLQDVWGFSNTGALALSGEFIQLLGVGVLLSTIPAGLLSDRIGRTRLIALAGAIATVGVVLVLITRDIGLLRGVAVLVGAGTGVYFSVNWALVTSLVPAAEAALFLGIANVATTLGGAVGQLGGPLIDAINALTGTRAGYDVLFGLAAIFFVVSAAAILAIREQTTSPGA